MHTENFNDKNDIQQLVARFDDAVNRRDVAEFSSLWANDATWEIGEPRAMRVSNAATIIDTWTHMLDGTQWLFRGSFEGVLTVAGDIATGRWPCIETGVFANGEGYNNCAYYDDEYVRSRGVWLFAKRRYVYLWLSSGKLPGGPIADSLTLTTPAQ
jgi:ketosteroid isomerase-like protein